MERTDDDLRRFEAEGAQPLPVADVEGRVEHEGAEIWYAAYGSGPSVILLHGGLDHSGNWGYQVSALLGAGRRVVLIDSRGRGRSTLGLQPLTYELQASEVLAVMDALGLERAAIVGWSDGAIIGLVLALRNPARVTRVFAFGGNMDPSGNKSDPMPNPLIARVFGRAVKDYARLSATPGEFERMSAAVGRMMKTQPNYGALDLARISTAVAIVAGENDEFIEREHTEYLARTIPGASLTILPGVTHFAPLQRPAAFNTALLAFLDAP